MSAAKGDTSPFKKKITPTWQILWKEEKEIILHYLRTKLPEILFKNLLAVSDARL